jgi:thioredoxin-related protein
MKKAFLICLVALVFACNQSGKKTDETLGDAREGRQQEQPAVKNERPVMTFTLLDGSKVDAQSLQEKMVLVLFQPDCDHCQDEAKQIKNRLEAFKDYQLYFISSHPMEVIEKFAKDYGLYKKPNVHFGATTVDSVLDNYGAISAPSIYIYTKEGKLVEEFEGQVDVEMIIRHL